MSFKRVKIPLKSQLKIVAVACLILSVLEVINIVTGRSLNSYGLIPRDTATGWIGIFTSPFLHGSLLHFFSNIVPFAIFSVLVLQHGLLRYIVVTVVCILLSGALVWGLGRPGVHVGASGLIYGYFGFLLLAGIFSREIKLILISIFVGISYGGLIFGVLPGVPYISWESHLFGLLAGFLCAWLWAHEKKKKK
ncbi:rhomboid family intramembrane serine protease [Endozoicomonas arenosclerae]|uniref:rhomboid family intramembrane serine protease n=1 Tax=Endozoicomonas arenosclerae TaxID=1633495 RepID=UPI0007824706|nr:rhomboid family intramembrane serine protease [Endozoicomonas arenosclerae]